jgi:hypothetical protein
MKNKSLEFQLDYNGQVDCIDVDDFNITDESVLDNFVEKLSEITEFPISEHRTEIRVYFNENSTMDVRVCSYNSPEWDDFDEYEYNSLPSVEIS